MTRAPTPLVAREVGRTGLMVPPLGLGTVKLGRTTGLKLAAAPAGLPSDEAALTLLATARDLGVTLIDTAPAYGGSEQRLGELLPRVTGARWTVCTKVGERFDEATAGSAWDFSPAAIADSVRRSIDRLRRPVLDIVLLHFAGSGVGREADAAVLREGRAAAALLELKAKGLVRAVGASTASADGALLAIGAHPGQPLAAPALDCIMVTLNALDRAALPLVAAASARGAGVLVKKPLASGHADADASLGLVLATAGVHCAVVGTTSPANLAHAANLARAARGAN